MKVLLRKIEEYEIGFADVINQGVREQVLSDWEEKR